MTYEIKPIRFSGFKLSLSDQGMLPMSSSTQSQMEEDQIGCIRRASVDDLYL